MSSARKKDESGGDLTPWVPVLVSPLREIVYSPLLGAFERVERWRLERVHGLLSAPIDGDDFCGVVKKHSGETV
jgi:hypothetical protein